MLICSHIKILFQPRRPIAATRSISPDVSRPRRDFAADRSIHLVGETYMVARRRVPSSVQSARFTRRCVLSAHRDFIVTRGGGGWNMSTPASGLLRYHPF
ncbi:hypothetical protein DAI22_03g105200 [Oryza sativa Japonica Group]|nr:hypothetical protein DAI22_03g105200 [Oryza sativa Japonica Group]